MGEAGILYYFTNAYPYGMGEQWKKNELEVFCKYFREIRIVPLSYDGNTNPKKLPLNVSTVEPVLTRGHAGYLTIFRTVIFSRIFMRVMREFFQEKVFLSLAKTIALIRTVALIARFYDHPVFRSLRTENKKHDTSLYFFWGTGLAHALIFLNKDDFKNIVVRFHGIDLYEERHRASYIPFRKLQLKQMHLAAPISTAGKNYLLSRYAGLGFECDVFRLGCLSAGRAEESRDGIMRIATCSSIIPLKRLDLLAKALALVSFPIHWLHIGDGPARAEIEVLIKKLPTNASVTLAGKVDPDRLLQYYAGKPVDLFVNVSETEGVPVSIMEALSAGIPVLATNVGGTSELVTDDVGKLLPADLKPEQLAVEIARFNGMDSLAKAKMRNRCYQQYMLNCNAHVWAERIVEKLIAK